MKEKLLYLEESKEEMQKEQFCKTSFERMFMSFDPPVPGTWQQNTSSTASHMVYLALSSNLGDRQQNLALALEKLAPVVHIQTISSTYETEPLGYLDQPRFLNMVCGGETTYEPWELLLAVKALEVAIGRRPSFRNGPRVIDIDILLYDQLVVKQENLVIPHPGIAERAFVLVPLAEIAPTIVEPGSGRTVQELLAHIAQEGVTKIVSADKFPS